MFKDYFDSRCGDGSVRIWSEVYIEGFLSFEVQIIGSTV